MVALLHSNCWILLKEMIHSASIPLQVFRHDCQLNQSVCPNVNVNRAPARLSAVERGYCHLICQHDGLLKKTLFKRLIFPSCLQAYIKKIRTTCTKLTANLTRIKKSFPIYVYFNGKLKLSKLMWFYFILLLAWHRLY